MAKPRQARSTVLAGLVRVDLPRVQIEYSRRPVPATRLIEQPTGHHIRKETEIAAARRRNIDPAKANRRQRHFNHPRDGGERGARCAGAPIEIMFTRIHAGALKNPSSSNT